MYLKGISGNWRSMYACVLINQSTNDTSLGYNAQISHYMMTSSNEIIFRGTGPLCGEFTGPGDFPAQRPVTRSFDVFFDLRLNKRLGKQLWGWWFETPLWSLWHLCNDHSCWCHGSWTRQAINSHDTNSRNQILRIELTYQLSNFPFSRNFHVLLS